ncbi:hypothetical protein HBN83_22860 [Pseudomonas fragi]|uniref:hypothetical protein n=1 Tax=Pseudomonas fragi TaxID=296 RepID=UPI0014739C1B|nr:hypothetical protein [Pseudomonas fragi]NNB08743.1 hypothetical protein [Pseudomonas fragi]
MLLIALSGGTDAQRIAIADRLVGSGKESLAAFALNTPAINRPLRRSMILRDVLDTVQDKTTKNPARGLVIVHCLTEEEAQVVRAQGGVIWHVYGAPSDQVVHRQGDFNVTAQGDSFRHVLSPLDALSELVVPRLRDIAPLCAAAVDALAKA